MLFIALTIGIVIGIVLFIIFSKNNSNTISNIRNGLIGLGNSIKKMFGK